MSAPGTNSSSACIITVNSFLLVRYKVRLYHHSIPVQRPSHDPVSPQLHAMLLMHYYHTYSITKHKSIYTIQKNKNTL
jgi:hypothetical protein